MAVTTDPFDSTELAGFIPEVWPGLIMEELFAKAVMANLTTDLSEYARGGGDIIHVPDVFSVSMGSTAGTADTQSTQGAEITTAAPAQVDTTLTINTHSYVAYIIGDKDMVQLSKNYDYNTVYTKKSAGLLRTTLEAALTALWSGLTTNAIGDTATVLADAEIRQGVEALEAANFDTLDGETNFVFHPYTFYIQLGAVTKYYDMSQRGPSTSAGFVQTGGMPNANSATGLRGQLYGIPVYVSSNIVSSLLTYRNLLFHRSAFGYATQYLSQPGSSTYEEGRVRAQSSYELRNIGYLTVVDMIYGVAELRDAAAVLLNGSTAFIGS